MRFIAHGATSGAAPTRLRRRPGAFAGIVALVILTCLFASPLARADGVTFVIHGWNPTPGAPAWLAAMQTAIADERLDGDQNFGAITIAGNPPVASYPSWDTSLAVSTSGEIVVTVDWTAVANHQDFPGISTQQIAAVLEDSILNGQSGQRPLAELPIHLIGHSRGGSVVCELARRLGEKGLTVDHLTPLDPHPLTLADQPNPYNVIDAVAEVYDNVLFADGYYQLIAYPQGQVVGGAYNREWTSIPGGYHSNPPPGDSFADHRNIYLMYHGTVDLNTPVTNGEATITTVERAVWWNANETSGTLSGAKTGFYYSRIDGQSDRLSSGAPVTGGQSPEDGYHDAALLGGSGARQALTWSGAVWPNVIVLDVLNGAALLTHGSYDIPIGTSLDLKYTGRDYDSASSVTLHFDIDRNPYNGNDLAALGERGETATAAGLFQSTVAWDTSGAAPATGYVRATITDGSRTRYQYAAPLITLTGGGDTTAPTVTSISRQTPASPETNELQVTFAVTFDEDVTGVATGNFSIDADAGQAGASIQSVGGSGTAWTVTVDTDLGDGVLSIDLNQSLASIQDLAGNPLAVAFTSGESYIIDRTSPESSATAPSGVATTWSLVVEWSFVDPAPNVETTPQLSVEVFFSKDGLTTTPLGVFPSSTTSTPFNAGDHGGDGLYGFYTIATDAADNIEAAPASADVVVEVSTGALSDREVFDYLLGTQPLTPGQKANADVNSDGKIDISDTTGP